MYQQTKLKSNVTVVTHTMKEAYSVAVGLWFKIGSRYENDTKAGISHFLEHMVFKGSKQYSGDEIKRQIEGKGGQLNGFTSEEVTCYLAKVPARHCASTFEILLDMSMRPLLKEEDVAKERTVIIEEIKMYKDLPQFLAQELLDEIMWPQHPLGRNIAGSIETVSALSKNDLAHFQNTYYQPENMVIVFAGNIKHKECVNYVKSALEKKEHTVTPYSFETFADQQKQSAIKTLSKETEQTRLAIGFSAYYKTHPKRFMTLLLSIILGGNMSSRLFDEIREKRGLAYEISSAYKRYIDTGAFYVHAGLDQSKLDTAFELIVKELAFLKKTLVSEAELTRAKEFLLGQLAMSLEDTMDHMLFLGDAVATMNQIISYDTIKKQVLKVKPKDIRSVACDIFHDNKANISIVGPIKDFNSSRCLEHIQGILG